MIEVKAEQASYPVHLGSGSLGQLPDYLDGATRIAVIYGPPLAHLVDQVASSSRCEVVPLVVPDAEAAKTPEILHRCWDQLAQAGFTRNDIIIGLGGGTVTDLAGFVAATWLRGVRFISIPTTVLAMVDAAIGGKTGINLPHGKNLVGAFYHPSAVLCDVDLLATLPPDELRAGMAEVVKCGFIRDTTILSLVRNPDALKPDTAIFHELVARAIQVKAEVVANDFREATSVGHQVGREALNYGHTLGHAIEALSGFTWRHGEAISVGMAWMARVSEQLLGLDTSVVALHDEILSAFHLPISASLPYVELRSMMSLDKKARGSMLRLVGLQEPGQVVIVDSPDETVLETCWQQLQT